MKLATRLQPSKLSSLWTLATASRARATLYITSLFYFVLLSTIKLEPYTQIKHLERNFFLFGFPCGLGLAIFIPFW